jgi:hypothetical protein
MRSLLKPETLMPSKLRNVAPNARRIDEREVRELRL